MYEIQSQISTHSYSSPISSGQRSVGNVSTLECSSGMPSGQSSTGNASSCSGSFRGQLSVRAKQLDNMTYIRTAASRIPKQPLPTPSKILMLGKSVAFPRPYHDGVPVEVYQYNVSDDWCATQVQGPQHAVVEISGFPDKPFANGCFQVAFTTRIITPCKFLSGDTSYIFKQHNIDEYGLQESEDASRISEESLHELQTANERKTAKEVQVAAVCCSLCYHFTQECKGKIQDFGKEICVLPSVHVKLLSGQFPPWGLIEPCIRGKWHKFLNNDGQAVAMVDDPAEEVVEFCNKSLAFAHWTYKHFEGRAVVCDLQGSDFHLTDLEIASSDSSLFGIGNLSHYALEMFKKNHCCIVYALELEALQSANSDEQVAEILASPER